MIRCCFCGAADAGHKPITWRDVAGVRVCSDHCASRERLRQSAEPAPRVIHVEEAGGARAVDQVAWATEWRRDP